VITKRELALLRAEWVLDQGVIEKDYVLGWLLAGIAQQKALNPTWVFKGGTCLRKCYYETFRFSEDLDFTIVDGGPEEPDDLNRIFAEVAEWIRERSGIEFVLDEKSFQRSPRVLAA
jgi:predicted nucleotidyltransferase component of viral defense system